MKIVINTLSDGITVPEELIEQFMNDVYDYIDARVHAPIQVGRSLDYDTLHIMIGAAEPCSHYYYTRHDLRNAIECGMTAQDIAEKCLCEIKESITKYALGDIFKDKEE